MDAAAEAAERILEITGTALEAGDFDRFARCFRLPYALATEDGGRTITSREDLGSMFARAVSRYGAMRVTDIRRRVAAALFDGANMIRTTHISQLFRGAEPITRPFPSYAVLFRAEDDWQVGYNQYSLARLEGHAKLLLGNEAVRPMTRPATGPAAACVEEALADMTQAMLTGDFAALQARVRFPLFIQGSEAVQVIGDTAALRRDFDLRRTDLKVQEVSDVVRLVKTVDVLSEDRLHATYRTHVLRGTTLVMPSYSSALTLERSVDGLWQVACVTHPTAGGARPSRTSIPGGAA